MMPLDTEGSPS